MKAFSYLSISGFDGFSCFRCFVFSSLFILSSFLFDFYNVCIIFFIDYYRYTLLLMYTLFIYYNYNIKTIYRKKQNNNIIQISLTHLPLYFCYQLSSSYLKTDFHLHIHSLSECQSIKNQECSLLHIYY